MRYGLIVFCLLLCAGCVYHPPTKPEENTIEANTSNQADTTVITYQEGDNTIEERRVKGFIYSVKVTPKQGKPYYLINADGDNSTLQNKGPQQKIPSWTLFSW